MKTYTTVLSFILILAAGCTGPVGPQGPRGHSGTDGVQIYSDIIRIYADDFVRIDEYVSVNSFAWDVLDEATVDEGLVLGYLRFNGETAWNSLPYAVPFEDDFVNLRYIFDIDSFELVLEGEVAHNNTINEDIFDGDYLRIIAIPPSEIIRGKGLDYSSYSDVVQAYGLEP